MTTPPAPDTADYVVIGAGSAGAVVAARLSERTDRTVLLLEAGGPDSRPEIHRTDAAAALALLTSDWSPQIDWGYVTEPEPGLGGRTVPVARGKVLGGSSSVNALMWVRGAPADYDGWSAAGNPGWSYGELRPYFVRSESYTGPGDRSAGRGSDGPVQVRALDRPSRSAQAFLEAAGELGYRADPDFDPNAGRPQGQAFSYQITSDADGARSSVATAYLRPASERPNLRVEVGARATRLRIDDGRVTAVEYRQDGATRTVRVRHEAVVSAGAFESPKLLMLSGLGPGEHLREHGIDVLVDLPGVGANLQDHVFVPVCFESLVEPPPEAPISEVGLFPTAELQFTFGNVKFLPPTAPAEQWAGPGFTFAPIGLAPRSRGEVRLRGTDPELTAVVRAGYLSDDADLAVLLEGLRLARRLAATPAFDAVRGAELAPGPEVVDEEDLKAHIRANATTLWHPVGTCRMGPGPDAVVDEALRVRGVAGLRVADASVMPRIVSGNTNAACVAIGEKAVDLILTDSA